MATCRMIRQESAKIIVVPVNGAKGRTQSREKVRQARSAPRTRPGERTFRRVADKPDPDQHLLERILSRSNMTRAWDRVKANKGAPGVDNMPITDFPAFAREQWE